MPPGEVPGPGGGGHPSHIGPYRIRRVLGEGGMGLVYEAEQTEPLSRMVAIKIIKLGMDTLEVVQRFATERQALAAMDHPSIAKAFDAGATEAGRPYFVMELIRGVPLTEYCDTHKLSTRQRIELFIEICQGVQHAHQKGVIHRDLKPSNLLVTIQDGKPHPKIIDFGIAKAMDHRLSERSYATELGQLIGTPAYMSPEQAEMSGLDIDTRSDIYSLGIVLYELVSGALPFDPSALERGDFAAQYVLREKSAPTPSNRFASLGTAQESVALQRHTTPVGLRKELKGDLDWIVLKAIEKDRTLRYETANGLAVDLQRLLKNEPITARPRSAAYAIRKFVRRHRLGVGLGAAAAIAVLGVAITMTVLAGRIARERNRAKLEAAKATSINKFMLDMLSSADPWQGGARQVTVEGALAAAVATLEQSFKDQPLVDAAVRGTIGSVYRGLGRFDEAAPLLTESLRRRRAALGENNEEVAQGLTELATLYRNEARYDSAATMAGEALRIRRRLAGADSLGVATSLLDLGEVERLKGDPAQADTLERRALAIRKAALGPDDVEVADAMRSVASVGMDLGRYADAEAFERPAIAIMRKTLGPQHPKLAAALNDLALLRMYQHDYAQAESLLTESIRMDSVVLGPMHPDVAAAIENLGNVYFTEGRSDDALAMLRQVLNIRRTMLGDSSQAVGRTISNMASVMRLKKDYAGAQPLFDEAVTRLSRSLGPDHPDVILTMVAQAKNLLSLGRVPAADSVFRDAVRRIGGPARSPQVYAGAAGSFARALVAGGRFAEAESLALAVYRLQDSLQGPSSAKTREAAAQLDTLYQKWGRPPEAARYAAKTKPEP